MLFTQEMAAKRQKIALIAILIMTLCLTYAVLHMAYVWRQPATTADKNAAEKMAMKAEFAKQLQQNTNELHALKQMFQESMKNYEQWMSKVKPLTNPKSISDAQKAQQALFAYLSKEIKNIETRFNKLPTINDIQQVAARISLHDEFLRNLQTQRKVKVLMKGK